ncbi:hypothetical protein ENSA5_33890 [Enhygromyxa salina]|uniref:Uncharacterized protein n=1 Tax=Enhygromyxa salina TaxID=215803 RepID=A0A2S9XXA6_9BACT|nr:hypothetical protein [Enhygromyxa salina]PRP97496.1 hypothetical protein ENSA5_33890 [Enhygromyxa salina]
MLLKASYILLSTASLGLLLFEAPRGALLTRSPDRGKVERQDKATPTGNVTIRRPYFVFLGGYHGGK